MATKRTGDEENGHSLTGNGDAPEMKKAKSDLPGGTLLFTGATDWEKVRNHEGLSNSKNTIWKPVRLQALVDIEVVAVSSSPCSIHMFAISDEGYVYGWGRNERGQLGVGDMKDRKCPTLVTELTGHKVVGVATGMRHSLFLTDEGKVLAAGDNRNGQTVGGGNTMTNTTPKLIKYDGPDIVKVTCGAEFSMILDKNGGVWSWGHPEYGQLGGNTDGSFLEKAGKTQFHFVYSPEKIQMWVEKDPKGKGMTPIPGVVIKDISCGNNHTVAIDEKNRAFSWGFGGFGRLGHASTADELFPRLIKYLDGPRRGIKKVYAGGQFNLAISENPGLCYMFGQYTSSKEANMYPKPIADLHGWEVRSIACSSKGWMVAAEDSVIGCCPSPCFGEFAHEIPVKKKNIGGEMQRASAAPCLIKSLETVYILACGMGLHHSIFIARNRTEADRKAIETFKILDQSHLD